MPTGKDGLTLDKLRQAKALLDAAKARPMSLIEVILRGCAVNDNRPAGECPSAFAVSSPLGERQ